MDGENDRYLADAISKYISFKKCSNLKTFDPNGPINNKLALV